MITDSYRYLASKNKTQYFFESDGVKGKIMKVVLFTHVKDDNWNLGFGDWHKGKVDHSVISNNNDIVKVIATVAKIAYDFLELNPQRILEIKPIDEKRKKLYNHIFRRHYNDIEPLFYIIGYIDRKGEHYLPEKDYHNFEIRRKFEI